MAELARFSKMNGIGNAIIVADLRGRTNRVTPQAAIALKADRATDFDQIMVIHDPQLQGTDSYIEILNSDGSFAQVCGNGIRCVVQFLAMETGRNRFTFETQAGFISADKANSGLISVDMGRPRLNWQDIPLSQAFQDTSKISYEIGPVADDTLTAPSVISMGNPHVIFWVDRDVNLYALEQFGPRIEGDLLFPEGVNVTLAHVQSSDSIIIRTWERGAGLTLACGSAACATVVSAARTGRTGRHVNVTLPGGNLEIFWRDDDHVIMTGTTEWEFSGSFDPETGIWQPDPEGMANER